MHRRRREAPALVRRWRGRNYRDRRPWRDRGRRRSLANVRAARRHSCRAAVSIETSDTKSCAFFPQPGILRKLFLELRLHQLAGIEQMIADRRLATAEDAGDLGGWQIVHLAHDENRLLLRREDRRNRMENVLDFFSLDHHSLLGVGGGLHQPQIRIHSVFARLLVAHEVDRHIRHHAVQPSVECVRCIVFLEVLPKLDEHELRDVFGVLRVADDAVAEAVHLGRLAADELLERLRLTLADDLNQPPIVRFDRLFGRNHQPKFRGHRDISTKSASKTSTNRHIIPIWVTKARKPLRINRLSLLCAFWSSGRGRGSTPSRGSSASRLSSRKSMQRRGMRASPRWRTASISVWPTSSSWPTSRKSSRSTSPSSA